MTEGERAASVDNFKRAIYPIWKGIEDRDIAAENKITMEEVNWSGQVLFEAKTVHTQDLAIISSGYKPSMETAPPEDFRKKAAASDKYSGWK